MSARTTAGIGGGALSGALTGASIGSFFPGYGTLIGAIIGAAVGAGVGALSLLLAQSQSKKNNAIVLQTTTIRDTSVSIAFGRVRTGGNYISLGNFWVCKDNLNQTPGRTVRVMNAAIGICEGPVLAVGNVHQDSQPYYVVANNEKANPNKWAVFTIHQGNTTDTVDGAIVSISPDYGFPQTNPVPWRNTCYAITHVIVGQQPRLPNFTFDIYGQDLAIRRSGTTTEANPGDTAIYAFYDGATEQFCYTLSSSGIYSAPYGLVAMGRQGGARVHTQPPAFVLSSVTKAWYLGRHDLLVMQDPVTPDIFWFGSQGLARGSSDWEFFHPSPDYSNPILAHYLDELHGILHTLHKNTSIVYFLRWNLLTGRVDRTDTALPFDSFNSMMYSPEMGAYIIIRGGSTVQFIDPDTGEIGNTYTLSGVSGIVGLSVSGQNVIAYTPSGAYYYNPYTGTQTGPYGSNSTNFSQGSLGGIVSACQNSWTGHVTVWKPGGCINFMASCVEDYLDVNANGSSYIYALNKAQPDFQWDPGPPTIPGTGVGISYKNPVYPPVFGTSLWYTDNIVGWVRDWSFRYFNSWNLVALQGFSTLAGAMWAACVKEANLDSERYAAGMDPEFFCLSSFESVHSYCVGAVQYINPDGTYRTAERYKFDYLLDSEIGLATFVANEVLTTCQGFRKMVDGQLHVGIQRPGMFPVWHFHDGNINADTMSVKYLGRGDGANRVRVDYLNILDEYRSDFAEAQDDFAIKTQGYIQQVTLPLKGIGRFGHADLLAKNVLDQSMGTRVQPTFKTNWLGYLVTPGDAVLVSNRQCAIKSLKTWVTSLSETEGSNVELTTLQHVAVLDAIKGAAQTDPIDLGSGPGSGPGGDNCRSMDCPLDGGINWFNGSAAYSPGNYTVTYTGGTYQPANDGSWQYAVAGFDIVTNIGGTITILAPAPAISVGAPGYSSQTAAETANAGQTVTITLTAAGPVGLRRAVGGNSYPKGSSTPTYNMCPD